MKNIFIIIVSIVFFSCEKKEKSYEELEAEVLSDVLPDLAKYEFENSILFSMPPSPPPYIDTLKFNSIEIDSILNEYEVSNQKFISKSIEIRNKKIFELLERKKVEFGVLDTLLPFKKSNKDKVVYKFDSLTLRKLDSAEFSESFVKINLVTYSDTFEGEDRNSNNPLIFLTRVLISDNRDFACFAVRKIYFGYTVFCKYSEKLNKWEIDKIVKDSELEN